MRGNSPATKTPPTPISTSPKPETRRISSGDNTLIRPVARTPYDSGSRDEGVLRVDFSTDKIAVSEARAEVRLDYERFIYYIDFRDRADAK